MDQLLAGLKANIKTTIATVEDLHSVLRLHHYILAVGNLAKGFPSLSSTTQSANGAWVEIFKVATQTIIDALKQMSGVLIIREAVSEMMLRQSQSADLYLINHRPSAPSRSLLRHWARACYRSLSRSLLV